MREIKFKVWDVQNNQFVAYGGGDYRAWCLRTDGKVGWISKYGYLQDGDRELIPVFCTNLKDKNGKEIYEGDVLDNGMYPHVMIFWDKEYAGFRVTTYSCIKKLSEYVNNWEVIGNIYENHELLKDTEE